MLLSRDILALVGILTLVRSAWNNGVGSISAQVDLAFFFPRKRVMVLSPMDVDGDGIKEALAVVKAIPNVESFALEIMDLKPLHSFRKPYLEPFQPKVIFSSKQINNDNAHPIHLTTGQLLIHKNRYAPSPHQLYGREREIIDRMNDHEINDRTRHYFCGLDWHDASSKCKIPCPSGQANECPNDERCFADTPCDVLGDNFEEGEEIQKNTFELTPGGGLPSVVSLWTNGIIILHSLTKNSRSDGDGTKKGNALELRELWRYKIFPPERFDSVDDILWEEISVVFLDAYSSMGTRAQHGMVVVSASYFVDGDSESDRSTFVVAVDAFKGELLWESHSNTDLNTDENALPLPMSKRGQTSFARRRSSVPRFMLGNESKLPTSALPNCMSLLKNAVKKEIFPYSYWGPKDAGVAAIHLNHKAKSRDKSNHHALKPHEDHTTSSNKQIAKKWRRKFHHITENNRYNHEYGPVQGKPNALVAQKRGGLQIRSLKNGKALCHLALLEENLYTDLNNDGVLDQVQIALHSKTHEPNDKFIWNLAGKLNQEYRELKENGTEKQKLHESKSELCHILALSGIPAKEEIFSAPVCGKAREGAGGKPKTNLDSVNPLVVEAIGRRDSTHDIIVALNSGMIHRIHGYEGRRIWALYGTQHISNFPTWEEESNHNALLARIQSDQVPPPLRPLVLTGDNSLVVISIITGDILAFAAFPQRPSSKPILADVSGDGSTDIIVITDDGIFCYQIVINCDYPTTQRIFAGFMLMLLMLAVIRNQYTKGGKRSTDE